MDTQTDTLRQERYGATCRKHISITESAHKQIEEWAEANDMYYSVAIETLALLGLGIDDAALLPRLVENSVERIFRRRFHRLSKLLAATTIAAAESNLKVDAMLLQLIRREAQADPKGFVQNMTVSSNSANLLDASIRRMRDEMKAMIHAQVVDQLKPSLQEALNVFEKVEDTFGEEENGHG
jgi:hypothetical protein